MTSIPPKLKLAQTAEEIAAATASVEAAITEVVAGRIVILVDDADRENEGDLCIAAEKVTPEIINFMAMHGRGLICLSLTEQQLERLHLSMM
ncbi:MAG: 3,4-dihydroxy-2-butanone-4-phosphate synthase, partial [Deltaproteobacteria bacterium]|nr:3,4-dihydroxy-2-butanone-4-phosphate synthase [Deltaproteobacteria bacterium]